MPFIPPERCRGPQENSGRIDRFEKGEFERVGARKEVAAQICLRRADTVQLRAQEIDEPTTLLSAIIPQYGLTLPQAGFVSTIFTVMVALFGALSGWFMARFGRKAVLVGGFAGRGGTFMGMVQAFFLTGAEARSCPDRPFPELEASRI